MYKPMPFADAIPVKVSLKIPYLVSSTDFDFKEADVVLKRGVLDLEFGGKPQDALDEFKKLMQLSLVSAVSA